MGGKRSDQHNIDPAEAGATDYKQRMGPHGTPELEVQKVAQQTNDDPLIPQRGENPALAEFRERQQQAKADQAEERGAGLEGE